MTLTIQEGSIRTPRQGVFLTFTTIYKGPSGALIVSLESNVMEGSLGIFYCSTNLTTFRVIDTRPSGEKEESLVSIALEV